MGRDWSWSRSLAVKGEKESSVGCMSGMLHYFDFHHLLFTGSGGGSANVSQRSSKELSSSSLSHKVQYVHDGSNCEQIEGLEAPRNSLELDESKSIYTSSIEEEFRDVAVAIQLTPNLPSLLKNKKKKNMMICLEEKKMVNNISQAETPRTPGVVARLMGLDILPNQSSPPAKAPETLNHFPDQLAQKKIRKTNKYFVDSLSPNREPLQVLNNNIPSLPRVRTDGGSYSLPETPRVSSERSRDAVPRLSLQINNKENMSYNNNIKFSQGVSYSLPTSPPSYIDARSCKKDHGSNQEESRSVRSQYFAREITKQAKETVNNRRGNNGGLNVRDEISSKQKLTTRELEKKTMTKISTMHGHQPLCSPLQIRFSNETSITSNNASESKLQTHSRSPPSPPPTSLPSSNLRDFVSKDHGESKEAKKLMASKCKKGNFERLTDRIKKQASPADKKFPSLASIFESHSSTDHSQVSAEWKICSSNASILRRNKDALSIPTKSSQSSLASNYSTPDQTTLLKSSRVGEINQQYSNKITPREEDPEYKYLKSIFQHAGFNAAAVPLFRWYSGSLPFDPIIFHQIELNLSYSEEGQVSLGSLQYRWNRKLLFHLVQEILMDFLPSSSSTSQISRPMSCRSINGQPLILQRLWAKIKSYPEMDCRVVGDIDILVFHDLSRVNLRRLPYHPLVVDQTEKLVFEIERKIIDNLLQEIATFLVSNDNL